MVTRLSTFIVMIGLQLVSSRISMAADAPKGLVDSLIIMRAVTTDQIGSGVGSASVHLSSSSTRLTAAPTVVNISQFVRFQFSKDDCVFDLLPSSDAQSARIRSVFVHKGRVISYSPKSKAVTISAFRPMPSVYIIAPMTWTYRALCRIPGALGDDDVGFLRGVARRGTATLTTNLLKVQLDEKRAEVNYHKSRHVTFAMAMGGMATQFDMSMDVRLPGGRRARETVHLTQKWERQKEFIVPKERDVTLTTCDANDASKILEWGKLSIVFSSFTPKKESEVHVDYDALKIDANARVYDTATDQKWLYVPGHSKEQNFHDDSSRSPGGEVP